MPEVTVTGVRLGQECLRDHAVLLQCPDEAADTIAGVHLGQECLRDHAVLLQCPDAAADTIAGVHLGQECLRDHAVLLQCPDAAAELSNSRTLYSTARLKAGLQHLFQTLVMK